MASGILQRLPVGVFVASGAEPCGGGGLDDQPPGRSAMDSLIFLKVENWNPQVDFFHACIYFQVPVSRPCSITIKLQVESADIAYQWHPYFNICMMLHAQTFGMGQDLSPKHPQTDCKVWSLYGRSTYVTRLRVCLLVADFDPWCFIWMMYIYIYIL